LDGVLVVPALKGVVTAWMVAFPALEGVVKVCKFTIPALHGLKAAIKLAVSDLEGLVLVTACKALQGVVTACNDALLLLIAALDGVKRGLECTGLNLWSELRMF